MSKNDFQYRHFLYLDGDEVLNTAAVIEGGEITEELRTLTRELGGNIGLKFAFASLGANLGARGSRRLEREMKLRRTVYVQADRVLKALPNKDITGSFAGNPPRISENEVVRCDLDLQSPMSSDFKFNGPIGEPAGLSGIAGWPEVTQLVRSWWQRTWQRVFRVDPAVKAVEKRIDKLGPRLYRKYNVLGSSGNILTNNCVLVLLETQWILDLAGFSRRATIIGQVIGVGRTDEQLVITDNGAAAQFVPRDTQQMAVNESPDALTQEGALTPAHSDVDISGRIHAEPCDALVVLKPIMIFR